MRLFAIFLILNFQLSHIFAFPPDSLELSSQSNHDLKGYECGNYFFTHTEVKRSLSLALASIGKGFIYPQLYRGELYSESNYEEYFLYPIKNGNLIPPYIRRPNTAFHVVFKRNSNEEIDVVAKITTGAYTRCTRIYNTHTGLSHPVPEIQNGYLCGHNFFSDKVINNSFSKALTKIEEDPNSLSPYFGLLYPEHDGYLMWPITREDVLYKYSDAQIGPFFLIINNEKKLVDVVVRGFSNNFMRCIRSRNPPKAPSSDPQSKLFVQPPKSGFSCGKVFFEDETLNNNAITIKSKASNAVKSKLPEKYSGPPFNEQCLIWPLLLDGSLSRRGHRGPYRLILKSNYEVLSVGIFVKNKLIACERKTVAAKKNHDTSDYHCNNQLFSHQQLLTAAEEACMKMKTLTNNLFPARYKGSGFEIKGPYFTYPVLRDNTKKFKNNTGPYRVVINSNCEVVGALTKLRVMDNGSLTSENLVKCHRLDDGPLPPEFFNANSETVFEIRRRH